MLKNFSERFLTGVNTILALAILTALAVLAKIYVPFHAIGISLAIWITIGLGIIIAILSIYMIGTATTKILDLQEGEEQ